MKGTLRDVEPVARVANENIRPVMLFNYPILHALAIGLFDPLHIRKFLDECYEKSIVVVLLFDQIMRDSEFL